MKTKFYDLIFISVLTFFFNIIFLVQLNFKLLRTLFGFFFTLLFPGYIFSYVVLKVNLDILPRCIVGVLFSIAINITVAFLLNFTMWGITSSSLIISLSLFIYMFTFYIFLKWKKEN